MVVDAAMSCFPDIVSVSGKGGGGGRGEGGGKMEEYLVRMGGMFCEWIVIWKSENMLAQCLIIRYVVWQTV